MNALRITIDRFQNRTAAATPDRNAVDHWNEVAEP